MSQDWSNAIIIIGAGLSGASAALTALESGLKVIIVEKEKKAGGNSVRASSGINASETHHQKQQNIKDTNELFAQDTAYSKDKDRNAIPTDLIWTLCRNSSSAVKWIEDHDLSVPVLSQNGGHSASRTHRPVTGAAGGYITLGLVRHVKKFIEKGQCKLLTQSKLTSLLKDNNNKVIGIEYENLVDGKKVKLTGGAVVIATGGFLYNDEMLKEYCPHVANLPTTNGKWTTGDGMNVAKMAGAGLVDMRHVQVHPTGFVDPAKPNEREKTLAAECLRAAGALLINKDGHRFVNELGHRDDVSAAERGQKGVIRLVLNPVSVADCEPHTRMYRDFFKVLKIYKNAQALADDMKIPVENLVDTFETYNQSARKKWCPSGKERFPGYPYLPDQELHVGIVTPVLHYVMGGIKIDTQARVLTKEGQVIPGLYACGETSGGIHGRNRLAGNSLVDCVVYGRIAGGSASNYSSPQKKSKL